VKTVYMRLCAARDKTPLMNCITAGHLTLLTKEDINKVAVPVQILALEIDPMYIAELKLRTFETV
jgi:hypothetical protein